MSVDSERIERLISDGRTADRGAGNRYRRAEGRQAPQCAPPNPKSRNCPLFMAARHKASIPASQRCPAPLRKRFFDTTSHFREVLNLHARMLTRVRNASEGMIRAIAEEVERQCAVAHLQRTPATAARPAQAMIFNSVIPNFRRAG